MVSALLLAIALTGSPAQSVPLHLECDFSGEDPSGPEQNGPRRIAFTIEARGSRVVSVAVEDPTGVFSSGNIVGFFSAGRGGSRYADVPRDEQPRWRGRIGSGRIELTGNRRDVSLASDAQLPGRWAGRLRYELGGSGSLTFARDGTLSCRSAEAAAAENRE
jgi:hypothetical protein